MSSLAYLYESSTFPLTRYLYACTSYSHRYSLFTQAAREAETQNSKQNMKRQFKLSDWRSWPIMFDRTETAGIIRRDPQGNLWLWLGAGKRVEARQPYPEEIAAAQPFTAV